MGFASCHLHVAIPQLSRPSLERHSAANVTQNVSTQINLLGMISPMPSVFPCGPVSDSHINRFQYPALEAPLRHSSLEEDFK